MAQKHLKELLKEDQEPFHLKEYIADKLKTQQIQIKKPKPISKNSSFFCKNACFLSLQESPLFDFSASPVNKKSPNRVFLHIPAKTSGLLLEAAMRIQKQSKPKTQIKNPGLGLFGSMLKRLTLRNRTQKEKAIETGDKNRKTEDGNKEEVNSVGVITTTTSSSSSSSSSSCSCNRSLDIESSSSGRSFEDDDGFEFANVITENNGDYGNCLSPVSPFRFALHKSPSPDRWSPVFSSPIKSPARRKIEDNVNYEQEDEEEKDQNSPVSVLDPPFHDDYDGHEEDGSYAFVQRAKQHLLHKLNRFEKLANLDPIELEKRMIEEEDEGDEQEEEYKEYDYESFACDKQRPVDEFIEHSMAKVGFRDIKKPGIKRLVFDLIVEEKSTENELDIDEELIKKVCKRLESWNEVESNTIDMMVEMDLRGEFSDWKKPQDQMGEVAIDIEVAIFKVLVEELLQDLA